ncbi:conserved hypothetical protein [Gammaproteobacteria bacterium]
MEFKDITASIAALVGMVVGIYNFVHARAAERVHLRVIPKSSSFLGKGNNGRNAYLHNEDFFDTNHPARSKTLSIEINNLSKFAVTVKEVGLRSRFSKKRMSLINPVLYDEKPWPRKLDPREIVIVPFDFATLIDHPRLLHVTHAYATTNCGTTYFGSSCAL